jgi:hypothetical protein
MATAIYLTRARGEVAAPPWRLFDLTILDVASAFHCLLGSGSKKLSVGL